MNVASLSGLDAGDIADVLAHTAGLHESLRRARVVVTGATGWFGTWLLDALVAIERVASLDLRIVAISRRPAAFAARHPRLHAAHEIEWIESDVRDPALHVDGRVTHVIHGATEASARLNAEEPDRMFDTIVSGTRQMLRIAARHRDVKVLLIGSGAVYGRQPADKACWSEDDRSTLDPLDVMNAYAEGKRAAEHLGAIWHASRGLDVKLARCFAFVGPHMPFDTHFAIGNFIRDSLEADVIRVAGDGRPMRSYLYAGDLVAWLLTILVKGRAMRPYNVGSNEAISIIALAARCSRAVRRHVPVVVDGRLLEGCDYVPDTSRAHGELGLRITVPLDRAIVRTMAWKRESACVAT